MKEQFPEFNEPTVPAPDSLSASEKVKRKANEDLLARMSEEDGGLDYGSFPPSKRAD